ncbi:hypothetical protein [Sphingobium phenoxybenzoativorans]|uniref:hypothetical protein n=1 Tax=Sphingobium phenoxybenzoativorans TaxID=1592790 RepID=UPI0008727543|nr:hypothetical protein [Sphingobium phenoxybenzoativorans]
MNRRMFLARVALSMTVLSNVMACDVLPKRLPTYRYRLTVEVQTPEGIKADSSVIEVYSSIESSLNIDNPRGLNISARGEAVAVDLPGGQTLFALLSRSDGIAFQGRYASGALLGDDFGGYSYEEGLLELIKRKDVAEVQRQNYPMLVRFGDINDPKTVEQVNPDDLSGSFGHGFTLKSINIQITDDPMTNRLDAALPSLGKYPELSLNPAHDPNDHRLSSTLHVGDFIRR